jgi:hypothetical protein
MTMSCIGHVARIGEKRNAYRVWLERQKERDQYEDLDVGGTIILKQILEKEYGVVWTVLMWLRVRPTKGSCELLRMLGNS